MSKKSQETAGAARKPPCESPVREFVAVAQCDFPAQMDVVRWLLQDTSYTVFYIVHDRDTYTAEEITEKGENGVITRKNGDGTESQFKAGDRKPEHIHIFIRVQTKMRASTLTKRFCEQLHFFSAQKEFGDKYEAAKYMTHRSFRARHKFQYPHSDVKYSEALPDEAKELYQSLIQSDDSALLDDVRTFIQIKKACDRDTVKAVHAVVESGDGRALRRIMSHAYFFDNLL